ncbi:MAG: DUF4160 domain-containing protein [Alphaproteobacteria bacterium]
MGSLARFGNVVIKVYGNDHLPPHFHVVAPDFSALIAIDSIAILRGDVPSDVFGIIREWAETNRVTLVAEWNRCNPRFQLIEG